MGVVLKTEKRSLPPGHGFPNNKTEKHKNNIKPKKSKKIIKPKNTKNVALSAPFFYFIKKTLQTYKGIPLILYFEKLIL